MGERLALSTGAVGVKVWVVQVILSEGEWQSVQADRKEIDRLKGELAILRNELLRTAIYRPGQKLELVKAQYVRMTVEANGRDVSAAAKILGIHRNIAAALWRKAK